MKVGEEERGELTPAFSSLRPKGPREPLCPQDHWSGLIWCPHLTARKAGEHTGARGLFGERHVSAPVPCLMSVLTLSSRPGKGLLRISQARLEGNLRSAGSRGPPSRSLVRSLGPARSSCVTGSPTEAARRAPSTQTRAMSACSSCPRRSGSALRRPEAAGRWKPGRASDQGRGCPRQWTGLLPGLGERVGHGSLPSAPSVPYSL